MANMKAKGAGKTRKFADGGDTGKFLGRLNKPAQEGYRYRSPGQTNAKDVTPNLREDVVRSQAADAAKIRRGLDTTDIANAGNRAKAQVAGAKALTRTASRALGAAGALQTGWDIGRAIDEKTGIGRKIVDKVADAMPSSREGVKLSKDSEERLANERIKPVGSSKVEEDTSESPKAKAPAAKKPAAKKASAPEPKSSMREGRNENISEETRSRAMKSVSEDEPEMRRGGKVKKYARGGGIELRGKTKGTMR